MDRRPALGKGLSALIPDVPELRGSSMEVDIDRLTPNTFQPRARMEDAGLDELAESVKKNGVIQPILVRKSGDRFQIIAGERRWRAANKAGLLRVPVIVREIATGQERALLELALIENLQREDLNPVDEAAAYQRLAAEFHLTQEEIAATVGKDRATVANCLRLLRLPEDVQAEVARGVLSMGHARALAGLTSLDDTRRAAHEIIARGLSVRETEALVRRLSNAGAPRARKPTNVDVHTRAAEERLRLVLGTRVRIVRKGRKGRIEIDFGSEDELIRIYEQLTEKRQLGLTDPGPRNLE